MRTTLFISLVIALLLPLTVEALTVGAGQNVFVAKDKTVSGVYVAGGGTLDLSGSFENDVMVGGGTVTISGPVAGDVLVGGGTVKITGEVKGGVRVIGGTVDLDSKVGRNVVLLGGTVTLGGAGDVAGELLVLGGTVTLQGRVAKPVSAWGGSFVVNGQVKGDVFLSTSDDCGSTPCVTIGPNADITGSLTYRAAKNAQIDAAAKISGTVTRQDLAREVAEAQRLFGRFLTFFRLWNLFSLMVVGLLLALMLPRTLMRVAETMVKRSGASIGWGALAFFAAPFAFFILALTVIGIPLMLVLLALYTIGLYVTQVFFGFFIGHALMRRMRKQSEQPPTVQRSLVVLATLSGIVAVSLVLDFLLGAMTGTGNFALAAVTGIIRLFFIVWPFGALLLVKWQRVRETEQ